MQYSSYRPKAATPKLNTRESNAAELTPSCVQQKRGKKYQELEQEFLENRNVISTYMKKKDYSRAAAGRYKETRRRRRT
jgi:hypothetical protein